MKYNIGDKFVVEIMDVEENDPEIPYCMNDNQWFFESTVEKLQKYVEPKSVVWRDGAVEQWESVCTLDKAGGFRWKAKNNPTGSIYWSADSDITDTEWWSRVLWLPASEFQMPEVPEPPEPVIEACPICGSECRASWNNDLNEWSVFCMKSNCVYRTKGVEILDKMHYEIERNIINKHNKFCRKLK